MKETRRNSGGKWKSLSLQLASRFLKFKLLGLIEKMDILLHLPPLVETDFFFFLYYFTPPSPPDKHCLCRTHRLSPPHTLHFYRAELLVECSLVDDEEERLEEPLLLLLLLPLLLLFPLWFVNFPLNNS